MRKKNSTLAVVAAIGLAAATGSAFTASNTGTPLVSAGQAATVSTGFAVSAVTYQLDDFTRSDYVIGVSFTLTPTQRAAQQTRVRLVAGGTYYACTMTGNNAVCSINGGSGGGVAVSTVDRLDIVAVSETA